MRDHGKLTAFKLADNLALEIYRVTAGFPQTERYGLALQMRRAAVSVASNIVEGCARHGEADFLRFLDMAYASACELDYQVSLAGRLGFLSPDHTSALSSSSSEVSKVLNGLIRALRHKR